MIGHRQFAILAAGAIDFSLAPTDQARLDRHLASCAECRVVAWRLRSDAAAIEQRPRPPAPPGMRERFESDWLPRASRPRDSNVRLGLLAVAALVTVGIAAIGVGARLATETQLQDPTPPASSTPSPSIESAQRVPALPTIGESMVVELSRGPVATDMLCAQVFDTGCATDVLAAFDAVWTTATDRIIRLDPATGDVVAEIETNGYPIRMAADDRSLWATLRGPARLVRIDPATGDVAASFPIDGLPSGVIASHASVWVVDEASDVLLRIDPVDGAVRSRIPVSESPWEVAATRDTVWVTDRWGGQLTEVDPAENATVETRPVPGGRPSNFWDYGDGVVTDDERLWIASGSQVSRYDPISGVFAGGPMPRGAHLAARNGRLWLASGVHSLVQEIRSSTLEVLAEQTIDVSGPSMGGDWETSVTATDEALWVRSYTSDRVVRIQISD